MGGLTIDLPYLDQVNSAPHIDEDPTVVLLRPPISGVGGRHALAAVGGVEGLARAIVNAQGWKDRAAATVVARPRPWPLLGLIGHFDAAARARFDNLKWQLETVLPRLLYLEHPNVELAVLRLADALCLRFGRGALAGYRFAAIPRGGHVVLGLLAYALGLDRDQMEAGPKDDRPLVVVDDCALSGARFREYLSATPRHLRVVFAPLVSTPELRAAIERDPRVSGCLSAVDLRDAAPDQLGHHHGDWQARWRERRPGVAFWLGRPQHVCFPWNEPDLGVWNPVTEREERGWPLLPPDRCLKHRVAASEPAAKVQVQPTPRGPVRPADDVLFGSFGSRVVVAAPTWPTSMALEGVAAAMWTALVVHGTMASAAATVAGDYDVEPRRVQEDMHAFVADLRQRGALIA